MSVRCEGSKMFGVKLMNIAMNYILNFNFQINSSPLKFCFPQEGGEEGQKIKKFFLKFFFNIKIWQKKYKNLVSVV